MRISIKRCTKNASPLGIEVKTPKNVFQGAFWRIMDEHEYTLEWLVEKFKHHHEEFLEIEKRQAEKGIIHTDDFSLPIALKVMCEEIHKLKKDLYEKSTPQS